jgi:two-component system, NtrC family, response regulator AtoC
MVSESTIMERELETPGGAERDGLHALVVGPEIFLAVGLPENGSVLIGRSAKAVLRVDDGLASREHARLHVKDGVIEVEDLDSTNGTHLGDTVVAGRRLAIDSLPLTIGSTTIIVQRSRWSLGARRICSHAAFERRLREHCDHASSSETRFGLVRLRLEVDVPWFRVFPILARLVGPPHVFALYAPGHYELLVAEVGGATVGSVTKDLLDELAQAGIRAHAGAAHYPRDGRSPDALLAYANAALEPPAKSASAARIATTSQAMRSVYELVRRGAATSMSILLLGETGVGKEIIARSIHEASVRADKPLLSLNCAGLSESLIESELFGYEKGAFTGATQSRAGLLESAQGGTVFLDEVGEMPLRIQASLLRVLETLEVLPVGGRKTRPIDVRFIAATNRDLEKESATGSFRRDLFFRLNGLTIMIPPLRERAVEIPDFAKLFVAEASGSAGRRTLAIDDEALALLSGYGWPGNVRELKNIMQRAVVLCDGDRILPAHLPVERLREGAPPPASPEPALPRGTETPPTGNGSFWCEEEAEERKRIVDALGTCAGNQSQAARLLGISRRTLITKLDVYRIPRPQKGRSRRSVEVSRNRA